MMSRFVSTVQDEPLLVQGALGHGTWSTRHGHEVVEVDGSVRPALRFPNRRQVTLHVTLDADDVLLHPAGAESPTGFTIRPKARSLQDHRRAVAEASKALQEAQEALDAFVDEELKTVRRQRDERLPKVCDAEDAVDAAVTVLTPYINGPQFDEFGHRKSSKAFRHLNELQSYMRAQDDDWEALDP